MDGDEQRRGARRSERSCPGNTEGLSALLDGEATYEQALYLALHLERCAGCQATFARLEATRDLLRRTVGLTGAAGV